MIYWVLEVAVALCFLSIVMLLAMGGLARTVLACFIVSWVFFYDYTAYHLENMAGRELFAIKLFFEFLLVVAVFLFVSRLRLNKYDVLKFFVLVVIASYAVVLGLSNGYSVRMAYVDFRAIFLPLLVCVALSSIRFFEAVNGRVVVKFGFLILFINGGFSLWDYVVFDGDYEGFWRYQSLLASKAELYVDHNEGQLIYQMVRDGNLRSSGFLVSALIASYLYAFAAIYLMARLLVRRKEYFFSSFIGFVFLNAFIYITHVRAGFLMVAFAFVVFSFYKMFFLQSVKKITVLILPGAAFLLMLFYLSYGRGVGVDHSSLGRLNQYVFFMGNFSPLGYGLGSFPSMFDSFFVYAFLELGVLSMAIFYLMYRLLAWRGAAHPVWHRDLVNVQFAVFMFLATFQHVAGSAYYFLFLFYPLLFRGNLGDDFSRKQGALC